MGLFTGFLIAAVGAWSGVAHAADACPPPGLIARVIRGLRSRETQSVPVPFAIPGTVHRLGASGAHPESRLTAAEFQAEFGNHPDENWAYVQNDEARDGNFFLERYDPETGLVHLRRDERVQDPSTSPGRAAAPGSPPRNRRRPVGVVQGDRERQATATAPRAGDLTPDQRRRYVNSELLIDQNNSIPATSVRSDEWVVTLRAFRQSFRPARGDSPIPVSENLSDRVAVVGRRGVRLAQSEVVRGSDGMIRERRTYELRGVEGEAPTQVRVLVPRNGRWRNLRPLLWRDIEITLARTPTRYRSALSEITVHPGRHPTRPFVYANVNLNGAMNIYGGRWLGGMRGKNYLHELGHLVVLKLWKRFELPISWDRAMMADLERSSGASGTSLYAHANAKEDFSETFEAYVRSRAGYLDPELRRRFQSRFEMLDRLFAVDGSRALVRSAIEGWVRDPAYRRLAAVGVGVSALAGAAMHLFSDDEDERRPSADAQIVESIGFPEGGEVNLWASGTREHPYWIVQMLDPSGRAAASVEFFDDAEAAMARARAIANEQPR